MFERFTDRVRRVMAMANQEAGRYNSESIGDLVVRIKKLAPGQEGACHELMADSPFELTLKDSVVTVEKII